MDITDIASAAPLDLRSFHMVTTHRHRKVRSLLAAASAALIAVVGLAAAPAAHADYLDCGLTELTFVLKPNCTASGIVRAEHDVLLTRDDLLRNLPAYEANGFTEDFIRTMPEITIIVAPGIDWIGCTPNNGSDGLCLTQPGEGLHESYLDALFPVGTPITVIGTPDRWIALMCGNFHPVQTPNADVEKVSFALVNRLERIDADTDVVLTVRATVRNNGPASQTSATDEVYVTAPADCTVVPAFRSVDLILPIGQEVTFDTEVTLRCADPSFHTVNFRDKLVPEAGRLDTSMGNNERVDQHTIAVYDDSDISVTDAALVCTDQTEVGAPFDCVGSALVTNLGPFGSTETTSTLSLTGP